MSPSGFMKLGATIEPLVKNSAVKSASVSCSVSKEQEEIIGML